MVTPFDQNFEVNYGKAEQIAEHLIANGSEGLIVTGTTGESPVLTTEEQLQLFTTIKKKVGAKAQVWGGTGSNDTAHVVALSKEAEKAGVDGLLLVTPYYNKPNQEGLYQHFKKVAESVSIPIMLYNVPSRTNVNMLPATIARLTKIDNIVAVKESSGDLDQVSQLKNLISEDIWLYSGDDYLTLPMLAIGAYGVVSVASHIVGQEILTMIEAFKAGEIEKAREIHLRLYPIFKGLFVTVNPTPVKAALNLMGFDVGKVRLPLAEMETEQLDSLKSLLKQFNLI